MADASSITPEELEELRAKAAERDAIAAERDHERLRANEEQRRADGLAGQVNQDRGRLVGAQVTQLSAQAAAAKTAVDGINSEIAALKAQIAEKNAEGAFNEAADLQEKLGDATARRAQAQQAHTYFTAEAEKASKQPADVVEAFLSANPGFNDGEREWIKRNPRYATDASFRDRVNAAHVEFTKSGRAGTPEYFEAIEQAGYMRAPRAAARPDDQQRQQQQRRAEEDAGGGTVDQPLSSAAELDEPGGKQVDQPPPRPSGAAAPSRRAATPPPARRGQSRRLTPDEVEAALAMSEYFPEAVQAQGEAGILDYYQDQKDNNPMAQRLRENWRTGA